MAINTLVPTSSSTVNAKTFNISASYTTYKNSATYSAGGYTVTTNPSTAQVNIQIVNSSSILVDTNTTSGSVSFTIPSDGTQLFIRDTSGSTNTSVTISQTSTLISGAALSGTLDTVTNTSTYNQTGLLYVMTVGGGSGGYTVNFSNDGAGGGGGGSGFISGGLVYTNTATSVTIGSGGNAGSGAGGSTSFGNLVSAAGGNSPGQVNANFGGNGAGNGGQGRSGGSAGDSGNASVANFKSITNGTTGGGGGGAVNAGGTGAGSGIGTGGNGGSTSAASNAGTGYGAGGGGGAYASNNTFRLGSAGSQGVVYVLRGF